MRSRAVLLSVLGLWSLPVTASVSAQSITSGSVTGVVERQDGGTVPQATVTLTSVDLGLARQTVADRSGRFTFGFVTPGTYELRVEALGFRPIVASPLTVSGGAVRSVRLSATEDPPPVTSVDTLFLGGAAASAWQAGGVTLGPAEIDGIPDRSEHLQMVAALSSSMDESLGSEGLPGALSVVVADGVPFYRAAHPAVRGEGPGGVLFPRSTFSSLLALTNAPDVEWAGGAGAFVALSTGGGTYGVDVGGAWSGDALWSSSEMDFETPSLMSAWGGLSAGFDIAPDTSHVFVAGEGFRTELPLAPRITADAAAGLSGLDVDVLGALAAPSVERTTRASGLARLDWWLSPTSRFMLRAAAGRLTRDFDGNGQAILSYGSHLPEESTEFSVAGALTAEVQRRTTLELRGGVSGSDRVFEGTVPGTPGAALVGPGTHVGSAIGGSAEVSRVDVHVAPVLHFEMGTGTVKGGMLARVTRNRASYAPAGDGIFLFDGASALASSRGYVVSSNAPESSFTTSEFGGFVQYDWEAAPGLRLRMGARIDRESIPATQVDSVGQWFYSSGILNNIYPEEFIQVGGATSFEWDVAGDGRSVVHGALSVHQGNLDPGLLHELFTHDGAVRVSRADGTGIDWPSGNGAPASSAVPSLTILGPDTRAPQSSRVSAGLVQQLSDGWSLYLGGALRRTDFLPRRRNLNLPAVPFASDAYGRDIFGPLRKDGSLVTADIGRNTRFLEFDVVSALDTDGYSEYRAVTVGLEHSSEAADFFATYTRSTTEDNWVGASGVHPWRELGPLLPEGRAAWSVGISDFDVPDRVVAGLTLKLGVAHGSAITALYRYRSGLPFSPRYRTGVDANGDGSGQNDIAFVPDASQLGNLLSEWPCLGDQASGFAKRNSCRGPTRHSVDASLRIGIGKVGDRTVRLVVDGLDLIEDKGGILDEALLLVDPSATLTTSNDGGTVSVPVIVNPNFGSVLIPGTRGRILRVGFRVGG